MKMKPIKTEQEYSTKDLGEASAILAKRIKLLRIERKSGICWFYFDKKFATPVADRYWAGELLIDAKRYNEAERNLKTRIFSQSQGENRKGRTVSVAGRF